MERIGIPLGAILAAASGGHDDGSNEKFTSSIPRHAQKLREIRTSLATEHQFRPEQIVRWKPGLSSLKHPREDEPMVFIAYIDEVDLASSVSHFTDPVNAIVGATAFNTYAELRIDARRIEPMPEHLLSPDEPA